MKEKNILLTTISNTTNRNRHLYFSHEQNGDYHYCDGISTAEAGSKYVLSAQRIDHILVVGPRLAVKDENIGKDILLRDFLSDAKDPSQYSEYKFFCYRIMQFLNQVDIEGTDIYLDISPSDKKEIMDVLQDVYTKKDMFHKINLNPLLFQELLNSIPHMNLQKIRWLRHYLYMSLQSDYKLKPLHANEDIMVRFIPMSQEEKNPLKMGNIPVILQNIFEDANKVNLFVDLQGLDMVDSHTFINILFMFQKEMSQRLFIQEIITTTDMPLRFTNPIENQKTRLELSELLNGIHVFLEYGKSYMVSKYWKNRDIKDDHIENLIKAMQCIDIAITLCNIDDLERGLIALKNCFDEKNEDNSSMEGLIFNIMETSIRQDYGKILEGNGLDVLELVKWAMRKHLYQQALTIIESRIPYDFVKNGVLYYARNEEEKALAFEVFNKLFWKVQPKDRYIFKDLDHYFIKFYRREKVYNKGSTEITKDYATLRINDLDNADLKLQNYTLFNGDRKELIDLMIAYLRIGEVRNQISHAKDFVDEEWSYNVQRKKIDMIKDAITYFVALYDGIKKQLDSSQKPVVISSDEFEVYHYDHPIFRNKKKQEE